MSIKVTSNKPSTKKLVEALDTLLPHSKLNCELCDNSWNQHLGSAIAGKQFVPRKAVAKVVWKSKSLNVCKHHQKVIAKLKRR